MRMFSKKSTVKLFLAVLSVGLASGYFLASGREISVQSDHVLFKDADELTKHADLIIIGETAADFSMGKPTVTYTSEGRIADFYTVGEVKPSRVFKGQSPGRTIPVLQAAVLLARPYKASKDLLINEDVTLMEKGQKYLLFLKQTDLPGVYSIVSLNQGKFNIDNLDLREKEMELRDEQFKTLKQNVLNKFLR